MIKNYIRDSYEMSDDLYIKDIEKYKKQKDIEYNKKYRAKIRNDKKIKNLFAK